MTISETTHARQLVSTALAAMLYEVSVNPKPGLVDPVDAGPHPDMNVFMFIDSAVSLRRYFDECVAAGEQFTGGLTALPDLFQTIRPAGIEAEKDMFGATHGVNTHKGAIFFTGHYADSGGLSGSSSKSGSHGECWSYAGDSKNVGGTDRS